MAGDGWVVRRAGALGLLLALSACGLWRAEDDPLLAVPGGLALTPLPPSGFAASGIPAERSPITFSGPGSDDATVRHYRLSGAAGAGHAALFRPPGPQGRLAIILAPASSIAAASAEPGGVWARTTAFKTADSAVGPVRYAPFETAETRCVWFQSAEVGGAEPAYEGMSLWGSYCLGRHAPAPQVFSRGIVRGLRLRDVADIAVDASPAEDEVVPASEDPTDEDSPADATAPDESPVEPESDAMSSPAEDEA